MKRNLLTIFGVRINGYDLVIYIGVLLIIALICYNARIYHLN